MFNSVQFVRDICQQRNIPVSQLEKECGFSNGYLNPKKITKIPYDRAQRISQYLNVSVEMILTGEDSKKASTQESGREVDIKNAKIALFGGDGEVTDEMWEEAIFAAQLIKERHKRKKD